MGAGQILRWFARVGIALRSQRGWITRAAAASMAMARQRLAHQLTVLRGSHVAADVLPATMRALIKEGDTVSVQSVPLPACEGSDLLVRVEAAALNPTDMANIGVMGPEQAAAVTAEGGALSGGIGRPASRPRGFGGEGSGVVVAAGPDADPAWLGKRVACWSLLTQGSYAEYYKVPESWTVELPDDVSFVEAAAPAINPITALGMIDEAKMGGHTSIVHTAAASQLGQMLVSLCKLEGIDLINVVRRQEQVDLLEALGAEHCVNITDDSFRADFGALATSLNATLAFDAVGGDTTRQIMLGMPGGVGVNVGGPKTRICVYGALGGGDIVMPKAGQMLGLKHSVSVEGWNYAGWMASIGDTRRYAEQAKAVRVHPQSCPGPRACLCFTRVPCCLSMPPACLAVCAYLRACAVAGVDAWRRPQDDLREAVSAGGLGGA
jgi:NADPH:quinone reductase-like Zn-dependent oxidoreductase